MYVDKLLKLSDSQALTSTAVSTNVVEGDTAIGIGEALAMVITVGTAADTASGNETYSFAVETSANADLSSNTVLATKAVSGANLTAGAKIVIPFGHDELKGFVGVRYTLGGTTPSITVDAFIQPLSMVDGMVNYPSGFTV